MASLKSMPLGLQSAIVTIYDQTKTTLTGNVASRTLQSTSVISPPPNRWLDVFTDSVGLIGGFFDVTSNGRIYVMTTVTTGAATLMLYNFNFTTGIASYVGKVALPFANTATTTHTVRGIKVDDTNTSAIKAFVATSGSVVINGGLYLANGLALTDFTPTLSVTLTFANGSNQKAMYLLEDPANIGAGQLNIAAAGLILDKTNQIAYVHNGVAATHQYYLYDYSQTPNVPQITCTTPIATPGVVNATAHGFAAGDQVTFTVSGGALPTGLVAGTVYFVLAAGLTANAFEVSGTTGGAAIAFTGTSTGTQAVGRAFGITSALWKWKTGNLPALTGTLAVNNSERGVTPGHTSDAGSQCVYFGTSTNLYFGKMSELTSGTTAWPSLVTANILGSTNQFVAPTLASTDYDSDFDSAIYTTNATIVVGKQLINNVVNRVQGVLSNAYLEGVSQTDLLPEAGVITLSDMKWQSGWLFFLGGTTGQRGIVASNTSADYQLGTNFITSPVLNLSGQSKLVSINISEQAPMASSPTVIFYRTSGFSTITGGWTQLPLTGIFPANVQATQVQFQIGFQMVTDQYLTEPAFVIEGYLNHQPINMISDNWEGSVDNTSPNGVSPAYSAFRLTTAYTGSVPQLFFRAYDDSNNLVASADTVTNPTLFQFTTNNGTSWTNLGTIPNTILTTEVRYLWSTPPGVRVTVSLKES